MTQTPGPAEADPLERVRARRLQVEERVLAGAVPELLRELERRLAALERRLEAPPDELPPAPPPVQEPKSAGKAAALPPASPAGAEATLAGKIAEGVLADILQMLSSNLATGVFSVDSSEGLHLELSFDEGQIVHAHGAGLSGDSAFFAAMAIDQGRFRFCDQGALPPERTIGSKTQFLILEALRQIDESRAGGGGE